MIRFIARGFYVLLIVFLHVGLATGQQKIYWTDVAAGTIQRIDTSGGPIETVIVNQQAPTGIAVDVKNGMVYWADIWADKIQRAKVDGSAVEVVAFGSLPYSVELDASNGKLYWIDRGIIRADFDGNNRENISIQVRDPVKLALDLVGQNIYWSEAGKGISRANRDGSSVELIIPGGSNQFGFGGAIEIDQKNRHVYWAVNRPFISGDLDMIMRSNLDGSNPEVVVEAGVDKFKTGVDIAVDPSNDVLYWSEGITGSIWKADFDGNNITNIVLGLQRPAELSLALTQPTSVSSGGYWRFEGGAPNSAASGSGSVIDDSGEGFHGNPGGIPTYKADVGESAIPLTGESNNLSLEFNDVGDRVSFGSVFPFHQPGDATVEIWLKYNPSAHQSVLWTRSDDADTNRFNFFVNGDSTFGFDYRTPSGSLHKLVGQCCTGVPIAANTWVHLAIVRTGNTYRLYMDGLLAASAIDIAPDLPTTSGWQLSGRGGYMFVGAVDELRFSNRALIPCEFLIKHANKGESCNLVSETQSTSTSTSIGSDVEVSFAAGTITFSSVDGGGDTTITPLPESINPLSNFQVLDQFFEINTTAAFSSMVEVCLNYDDSNLTLEQEQSISLLHFDLTQWLDVTMIRDTLANTVCGEVSHFSEFTVALPLPDQDNDGIPDNADNCTVVPNSEQRDTNSDGFGNLCDPDLNNDGFVNFGDLAAMKAVFFTANKDADLNGDGFVNFDDLAILKSFFGMQPGPSGLLVP